MWRRYFICLMLLGIPFVASSEEKQCFYVNSYHMGYEWSDKIEAAVRSTLKEHCNIRVFYMDTKRHKSAAFARKKALEAKSLIDAVQPDVVIVSDDNASKYLIAPYYKNTAVPVVFCGINWTAEAYGYPYENATGMIEVSAIGALLDMARHVLGEVQTVAFIAVKGVRTDEKEFEWMKKMYGREGVSVSALYVSNMQEWEKAYQLAQESDLIVLNNHAGILHWDTQYAMQVVMTFANKLTVSTYDFMAPYAMLSMTKVAEEQGEWAGKVAIRILQGKAVSSIPVVANKRFNMFINQTILQKTKIHLPDSILYKAIQISR